MQHWCLKLCLKLKHRILAVIAFWIVCVGDCSLCIIPLGLLFSSSNDALA